jgi:FkbM family methyltransferase
MKPFSIFSLLYSSQIASRPISFKRRILAKIRKLICHILGDLPVKMEIHGRLMILPISHELPNYLSLFPNYDRLPRKLSNFLITKKDFIRCIDVGANIGDTVAAFYHDQSRYLAIEPNPHFYRYLGENWGGYENIITESILCSSVNMSEKFDVIEQKGTAQMKASESGSDLRQLTLDSIIQMHPEFLECDILKIDTDGFDFKVMMGAKSLIEKSKPAVLFECDDFGNTEYISQFSECIELFLRSGYRYMLLYDHLGDFMGVFDFESRHSRTIFENLLKWQEKTQLTYFDILMMHGDMPLHFLDYLGNHKIKY